MLTEEDIRLYRAYYHTNTSYYMRLLERYHAGKKFSFNIKVFFIHIFFMCYRKMYRWVFVFFLVSVGVFTVKDRVFLSYSVPIKIQLAIDYTMRFIELLVLGFLVNKLYIQDSIKHIQQIKRSTNDPELQLKMAAKKGGVNWVIPFILW